MNFMKSISPFTGQTPRIWNIDYNPVRIVTDNAANIFLLSITVNGGTPCYAHTHKLIVQTTIKVIKNGKEKVETIVHCLKFSAHVLAKLRSIQKEDTNTRGEAEAGS